VRVMPSRSSAAILVILMMIPLRRAFIGKQHGKLKYPEGTCLGPRRFGRRRRASDDGAMVFSFGFGIAFV